jgi:hypothetical protein
MQLCNTPNYGIKKLQKPTCWSELPEKIWLRVFQNLNGKSVNSLHLVCRNLHQIANLHVHPIVRFKKNSPEDVESLLGSQRIFEELAFSDTCFFLLSPKRFEFLEEYIGFLGFHVKKLTISKTKVNQSIVQKLLDLLPNLEGLELNEVWDANGNEELIKWNFKSTKIKRIKLVKCPGFDGFLESLDRCAIEEAECSVTSPEVVRNFLKPQARNLKKLINCQFTDLLVDRKDLRLEHFEYGHHFGSVNPSLQFLQHQLDLKFLKLSNFSNENFNLVLQLRNLETLELHGWVRNSSWLNNLYKLEKLKRLKVSINLSPNILENLRFGIFVDLVELDAYFEGASVESLRGMNQITPNLKRLWFQSVSYADRINVLLEALDGLESVKIEGTDWRMSDVVHPNIKYLHVRCDFKFSAEKLVRRLPNLRYLKIERTAMEATEPFFITMLSRLKQLKTLYMQIWSNLEFGWAVDRQSTLQCFQQYGEHLDDANVVFRPPDLQMIRGFAVEKQSGGSFCINQTNCSFNAEWMSEDF